MVCVDDAPFVTNFTVLADRQNTCIDLLIKYVDKL